MLRFLWVACAAGITVGACQVVTGLSSLETEPVGGSGGVADGGQGGEVGGAGGGGGLGGEGGDGGDGGEVGDCEADCAPYACDDDEMCTTSCNSGNDCADDAICDIMMNNCFACGGAPGPAMPCMGPAACDVLQGHSEQGQCTMNEPGVGGDACVLTTNMPTGPASFDVRAFDRPAVVDCETDECGDLTLTCRGPQLCEVRCDDGACNGLTLTCDPIGECRVVCTSTNTTTCNNLTVNCQQNTCHVEVGPPLSPPTVNNCAGSCDCSMP